MRRKQKQLNARMQVKRRKRSQGVAETRVHAGDVKPCLRILNSVLAEEAIPPEQYAEWRHSVREKMGHFPMWYPERQDVIIPQWAVQVRRAVGRALAAEPDAADLSSPGFGRLSSSLDCGSSCWLRVEALESRCGLRRRASLPSRTVDFQHVARTGGGAACLSEAEPRV